MNTLLISPFSKKKKKNDPETSSTTYIKLKVCLFPNWNSRPILGTLPTVTVETEAKFSFFY